MRVSPSQLQNYDRCKRKWGFKLLDGLEEPHTAAQEDGVIGHARIERYLREGVHPGEDHLGRLIQLGMRPDHIPVPRPGLLVEHNFSLPIDGEDIFYGFADCIIPPDERGIVVVADWKFTSSLQWAKTADELRPDAQGVGYSKVALDLFPEALGVENRWVYFDHKRIAVRPVRVMRTLEEVAERWAEMKTKALAMIALRRRGARAIDLPGNKDACGDYRGCPFRDRCDVGKATGKGFTAKKVFSHSAKLGIVATSTEGALVAFSESSKIMAQSEKLSLKDQLAKLKEQSGNAPASLAQAQAAAPAPAPAPAQAQAPAQTQATPAAPAAAIAPSGTAAAIAPSGTAALASLQKLKGAQGVNPPEQSKASPPSVPAQATTLNETSAPAAETAEPSKRKLKAKSESTPMPEIGGPVGEQKVSADQLFAASTKAVARVVPASAKGPLTVLYKAVVAKFPDGQAKPAQLIDLLAPVMREVADEAQKAHWLLIPYNEGKALLAQRFDRWLDETQWKGALVVDPDSPESQAVREVLNKHADLIVWGVA